MSRRGVRAEMLDRAMEMVGELNRLEGLEFSENVVFGMLKVLRAFGYQVVWNSVLGQYELWV